jgi:hypothetical protein
MSIQLDVGALRKAFGALRESLNQADTQVMRQAAVDVQKALHPTAEANQDPGTKVYGRPVWDQVDGDTDIIQSGLSVELRELLKGWRLRLIMPVWHIVARDSDKWKKDLAELLKALPRKAKGRPKSTDPAADRRVREDWETGRYSTYEDLGKIYSPAKTEADVRRALDRDRNRK